MNAVYDIPELPLGFDFETKAVLRQLNKANKRLAELKGVALTIPNENILLSSLVLQEALDSSAVENIVTTSDDLYRADLNFKGGIVNAATKEVLNYRQAMQRGFDLVRHNHLLTLNNIKEIQQVLENNNAGFRTLPGTKLKSSRGDVVYTPPQNPQDIQRYMANLESYINESEIQDIDPLIKLAVIHHQFESIHPFYDGNGRTGRILNILYLIHEGLLNYPVLYLSRYINANKSLYYSKQFNAPDNALNAMRIIMCRDSIKGDMNAYIKHRNTYDSLNEVNHSGEINYKIAVIQEQHKYEMLLKESERKHATKMLWMNVAAIGAAALCIIIILLYNLI